MFCVLTVWASIRDPASIGGRRLFETRRLLEVLRYTVYMRQILHCKEVSLFLVRSCGITAAYRVSRIVATDSVLGDLEGRAILQKL